MSILPNIAPTVLAKAKQVWEETITAYGREVELLPDPDDSTTAPVTLRAFCKRPKILGQWDRTQGSFDQEKWMVMVNAKDLPVGVEPHKFQRVRWDQEDHVVLVVASPVDVSGTVFGYRLIVKG